VTELLTETAERSAGVIIRPAFSRSETFHPRYGWLKKGFDLAAKEPDLFTRPDATTLLGVGKNMVRAIRYWCRAYKILDEVPNAERPRLNDAQATELGRALLSDETGWDPYLEDPASLWLLHWHLLRPPCLAPAWFAIFNGVRSSELTDESLLAYLRMFCDARPEWGEVADNSLRKDARCLLRMYASVTAGRDLLEDSIDSPFTELDLIRSIPGDRRHYVFNIGPKRTLPDAIVVFACLDFAQVEESAATLTTITRLANAAGGPGHAFKLTHAALAEAIERYSEKHGTVGLTHAAGARQLVFQGDAREAAQRVLKTYYRTTARRRAARPAA
jgi:Protein of unknown function (DUF4007)